MSTHNLCFGTKLRKIGISPHTPVLLYKATPNKLVDAHPIFMKKWGGWEVFIFYFLFFTPSVDIVKHLPVLHVKWK